MAFRFHVLGIAHLPTNRDSWCCGFTQKTINLCKLLKGLGHHVTFYGGEGSSVECDDFVEVVSDADRRKCYGEYDWSKEPYRCDGADAVYRTFNDNAIAGIAKRKHPHDFLLCTFGCWQAPVANAHSDLMVVESGVGYLGIFSRFRVFESYAWMNYLYGKTNVQNGNWYDAVIPNFFDLGEYPFASTKKDYALYFGRITKRKGVDVAIQVTAKMGIPLVMAGQMGSDKPDISAKHVDYRGAVSKEERAKLMGEARMMFVPTYYIEPFGGVVVEANLCGTPVITSDWGAFPEIVMQNVTGFRCRTFDEFCNAAKNASSINPTNCRKWGETFSIPNVARRYDDYFKRLSCVWNEGWYTVKQPSSSTSPSG